MQRPAAPPNCLSRDSALLAASYPGGGAEAAGPSADGSAASG